MEITQYILILGLISTLILIMLGLFLLKERNNYTKGCPQYQQITEPIYKRI